MTNLGLVFSQNPVSKSIGSGRFTTVTPCGMVVDWSNIDEKYRYLTIDSTGEVWLWASKPVFNPARNCWIWSGCNITDCNYINDISVLNDGSYRWYKGKGIHSFHGDLEKAYQLIAERP